MASKTLLSDEAKVLAVIRDKVVATFMRGASFVMIFDRPEAAVALSGTDVFGLGATVLEYTDARDRGASMSMEKKTHKHHVVDEAECTVVFKNLPKDMKQSEFQDRIHKDLGISVPINKISFTRSRHSIGSMAVAFVVFDTPLVAKDVMNMCKNKAMESNENDDLWQRVKVEAARSKSGDKANDSDEAVVNATLKTLSSSGMLSDVVNTPYMRDYILSSAALLGFNVDFESANVPCKARVYKQEVVAAPSPSGKLSADAPIFIPGQPIQTRPVAASAPSFSNYRFDKPVAKSVTSPVGSFKPKITPGVHPIRQPKQPSDVIGFASGRGAADLTVGQRTRSYSNKKMI